MTLALHMQVSLFLSPMGSAHNLLEFYFTSDTSEDTLAGTSSSSDISGCAGRPIYPGRVIADFTVLRTFPRPRPTTLVLRYWNTSQPTGRPWNSQLFRSTFSAFALSIICFILFIVSFIFYLLVVCQRTSIM